jgi:hypothetical protein
VAFGSTDKRDFLEMASLARWVDLSPGEVVVKKGHHISEAIVLVFGETEGVLGGKTAFAYRPGQLIGNVSAYSGLVSPMDVVARGAAKLAIGTWYGRAHKLWPARVLALNAVSEVVSGAKLRTKNLDSVEAREQSKQSCTIRLRLRQSSIISQSSASV